MSEVEDSVATVVRLLGENMYVVKDDGGIADIFVSGEWYDRELFKNYDGQVTVGLGESVDQKLELAGRLRRRLASLRVNLWAMDRANAESARLTRKKMVEEVNRIVRANRNKPNETTYDFAGLDSTSETHKAFDAAAATELVPSSTSWAELSVANYQKIWSSDNLRHSKETLINNHYPLMLFRFKIGAREQCVKKIVLSFEGNGTSPLGDGVTIKVWNHVASAWQQAQSGTGGEDQILTITISSNWTDYIDSNGYVWLLAKSTNPSNGDILASLRCDFVQCTIQVYGISFVDVVSYRFIDVTEFKPYLFRAEFLLKSWLFETVS